jgi:hypothetical protein
VTVMCHKMCHSPNKLVWSPSAVSDTPLEILALHSDFARTQNAYLADIC